MTFLMLDRLARSSGAPFPLVLCVPLLVALLPAPAAAAGSGAAVGDRLPLLMPGKTSLYQRILTRPGAQLRPEPIGADDGQALPPLSVYFVYGRSDFGNQTWLEVGAASRGQPDGWVVEAETIPWKQTLILAFTGQEGREPALFFRDRGDVEEQLRAEQPGTAIGELRTRIQRGDVPPGFPVISMEPTPYVDPNKNFYLLPILDFEEARLAGFDVKLLEVAAVTLRPGTEDRLGRAPAATVEETAAPLLKRYRTGVVFVIDSTISMGPYLDRTREAMRRIYSRLKASGVGRNISFGLIAFRDRFESVPGSDDYVTRIFAELGQDLDQKSFFKKIGQVAEAPTSNRDFAEDAYAGVYTAIRDINWRGYDGRFIILITDASARGADDPLARDPLTAETLRTMAQDADKESGGAKIAIYVMHLQTPAGRSDHEIAAAQYKALSQWDGIGPLYFPVPGGAVTELGNRVDNVANLLLRQVESAREGRLAEMPVRATGETDDLARKTALVGRAMQLAYVGRATDTKVPPLISAWVAQRDFAQPSRMVLEVRVMVSKNQLSDLQETLQTILEEGERTRLDSKNFFNQLRSAAARMARDPENVSVGKVQRLADVGLVGEWLADLPYPSAVMTMTEDQWISIGSIAQREFLDSLEAKIVFYRDIHDTPERWIWLDPQRRVPGDAVCSIPVDMLP